MSMSSPDPLPENANANGERAGRPAKEAEEFRAYARTVRPEIDRALEDWLKSKDAETSAFPDEAKAAIDASYDLARRGGKRLRAVLLAAAYEAFGGVGGRSRVMLACVALELLQVYLLIHDDWMDGDDTRRGAPSVPAMMRRRFASKELADASAILSGDYAAGMALEALLAVPCSGERVMLAARELGRVEKEVVAGQLLDIHAPRHWPVEATHALKTASYTVRAPVLMGARLAGAGDDVCRALEGYARPLGIAFQLADDLLGTFGDPAATGKPPFSDIKNGKRTALVAELASDPRARSYLELVGKPDALEAELERFASYLVQSGARARVEARIEALSREAEGALEALPSKGAIVLLRGAIPALTKREI